MTTRPSSLHRAALSLGSAALALTALAGCGDGSDDDTTADPTSELSLDASEDANTDLPEGVPTEEPRKPTGLKNTPADAKAFAEHAFNMFNYAAPRNDLRPLLRLGSCPSCTQEKKARAKLKREGVYSVHDRPVNLRSISPLYRESGAHVFGISFDLPPAKKINGHGEVLEKYAGQKKKYMEVAVRFEGTSGDWSISPSRVDRPGAGPAATLSAHRIRDRGRDGAAGIRDVKRRGHSFRRSGTQ